MIAASAILIFIKHYIGAAVLTSFITFNKLGDIVGFVDYNLTIKDCEGI